MLSITHWKYSLIFMLLLVCIEWMFRSTFSSTFCVSITDVHFKLNSWGQNTSNGFGGFFQCTLCLHVNVHILFSFSVTLSCVRACLCIFRCRNPNVKHWISNWIDRCRLVNMLIALEIWCTQKAKSTTEKKMKKKKNHIKQKLSSSYL